jgi:superfamily I DNA/RNA helicase
VIAAAGMLDRLKEQEGRSDFYARVFPELFVEAVLTSGARTWDVVVVDEAQDLLTLPHIDAIDVILTDGINTGRWHIFLDPMQNLYNDAIQEQVMQRLGESQPAFDDLFENCRNTREVAVQASIVSGIDLALDGAPEGPECSVVFHRGASCIAAVEEVVRSLISSDVRPQEIVVLSPLKLENSCLAGISQLAGVKLTDVSAPPGEPGLLFSTMHGFKGLERRVVLATDMERIGEPEMAKLFYAGLSRATMILKVFLPDPARPAYDDQVKQFAKRNLNR